MPLLVGFDREETFPADLGYPLPDPYTRKTWIHDTDSLLGPVIAAQARPLYPASAYDSRAWAYITMQNDAIRGCPTRRLANEVAAPTWRWLYTHTYENDPFLADGRAAHFFEESFLWGHFGLLNYTPTAAEELLSERMVGYWTNYAKTGDPNGPGLPTWPRYDASEPTLILDDQISVLNGYHVAQCGVLDTIDQPYP